MKNPARLTAALICALSFSGKVAAEQKLALGTPFADNAILQRDMKVPVWGWSEPGAKVTVEFAGQKKEATAGEDGKWTAELEALEASAEPAEMKITGADGETKALKNVLVGEVWLASGQSNMQWTVGKSRAVELIKALEEAGEKPPIRECKVTDVFAALHPIEKATGEWSDGSDFKDYSAIAFSFALKLQEELGVPVGILNCSFSQTSIEAWTPREGFAKSDDPYIKSVHQKILESDPATPEHKTAWEDFYGKLEASLGTDVPADEIINDKPGNLNGNRDATWLFNARLNPMIPYAIRGAIWNQGYANMGGGIKYYANLHAMIDGWREKWDRPELPVYFHQFYSAGKVAEKEAHHPAIGQAADMRTGTWLARDIPNAGMASQIDVEGAIHYGHKVVPGRRLALHALKNQYGKDVAAEGPMFKSYSVDGDKLTVEFENAEGGLVVAETGTNALGKPDTGATGFADPKVIENGADQVEHFYLAGEDRVWHPAKLKIEGDKVVLTAEGVTAPKGVSYGTGGIGFSPNLYNKALLPTTPFIVYENEIVTAETWPDDPMKIAGVELDPSEGGILYHYRKLPILSTQFRDNAVLQADKPVTIWGGAVPQYWDHLPGEKAIKVSFGEIQKTIPVEEGMEEWSVTLPAIEAGPKPYTLKVTLEIDGELAHERTVENIVFGDVYYVGAPAIQWELPEFEKTDGIVRTMQRKAKRSSASNPSRFSVAVSTTPKNRFASLWEDAEEGPAAMIGHRIAAKTGRPVGIIFMRTAKSKEGPDAYLKEWIAPECLDKAPSLMEDFKELAGVRPGNEHYAANVRRYVGAWKKMWDEYVPEMIATKAVPDQVPWGKYPSLGGTIETNASETYNTLVHSFTPASLSGIIFLSGPTMVEKDGCANFGEQLSVLANCLKEKFGGEDVPFVYTVPGSDLAPKVTKPGAIEGKSEAVEIGAWEDAGVFLKTTDALVK